MKHLTLLKILFFAVFTIGFTAKVYDSDFSYNDVLNFDGHINVHLSANDLATIVAQGNIGSNVSE